MKKNILAENMLRFGTKNLTPGSRRKLNESSAYKQGDMVTYNGQPYYIWATAEDFNPNEVESFQNAYAGTGTLNTQDYLVIDTVRPFRDHWLASQEVKDHILVNGNEVTSAGAGNTFEPRQEDMVTLNGKQHAVLASAWDESSINPNDAFTANLIRRAGASANNWVLLQKTPGSDYRADDDLGPDQLRSQWNGGAWMFAPADKLQPATTVATAPTTTLEPGSWEAFTAAIANKINTDKNDPRTNLTSAEIDSAYEKMSDEAQNDLWKGIWGEYKWSVGTNKPDAAKAAVDQAIRDYFSKVK